MTLTRYAISALFAATFLTSVLSPSSLLHGDDWPHWRGINRTDIITEESGWDGKTWLKGKLWSFSAGEGGSSPIVVGTRVFLTGWANNRDVVYCVDAVTGKEIWRQTYDSPRYGRHAVGDKSLYSGTCSTPEYDSESNLLFTLGIDGDLNAWDTTRGGQRVWHVNIYDEYRAPQRPEVAVRRKTQRDYGYTTSPLVAGDLLIVEVGGRSGNLVAFNKRTGREAWTSENRDEAGHTGGIVPLTVQGIPCVAVLTLRNLVVTRIDGSRAGQQVAIYPWTTDFGNNIPTPAVFGDSVIISTAYNHAAMCRVRITLNGATKVWENDKLATAVCSPVIHDGHIYWAWRGVHCVDFETGREVWTGGRLAAPGSVIVTADDRLIVYGNKGDLSLVETAKRSPHEFTQLETSRVFSKTDAWPHVVLANGRVICRDRGGAVQCFSTTAATSRGGKPVRSTGTSSSTGRNHVAGPVNQPETTPARLDLSNWPGRNDPGLVYGWKRGMKDSTPLGSLAAEQIRVTGRDGAKFDTAGRMAVETGSFHIVGAARPLLEAAKSSGQLTIEAILTTHDPAQTGPARIITFSTDGYHRNFSLLQERDELRLRLRTPQTGPNGLKPESILGRLQAGERTHVLVSYRDGELTAYINGKPVHQSRRVKGDFSNWDTEQQLVLGAEFRDGRNWNGNFDGIALLTRFIGPKEAMARYRSAIAPVDRSPRTP